MKKNWDQARLSARQLGEELSVIDWVKDALPSIEAKDPNWYAQQQTPTSLNEEYAYVTAATLHALKITNFWAIKEAEWQEQQLTAPERSSSNGDDYDDNGPSGGSWDGTLRRAAIGAVAGYAVGHWLGRL